MGSSTRFSVAVHVMTALAYHDGESMSSPLLARSVQTNPVVIRRLLGRLGKAGLVRARAGKAGGTVLARRPESITLMDIFRAVEGGSPFSIPDKPPNKSCAVSCRMQRVLASVLSETEKAMAASLEKVRLSDLASEIGAADPGSRFFRSNQ